jgi:hypothetical protein
VALHWSQQPGKKNKKRKDSNAAETSRLLPSDIIAFSQNSQQLQYA